ncbi:hypothetical protein P9112_006121 [Eukaryota sp. TZLM1-RC]
MESFWVNESQSNFDEFSQWETEGVQKYVVLESGLLVHADSMKKDNEAIINMENVLEDTSSQLDIYKSEIESYKIQLANANHQLTAAEADQNQLQDHNKILSSELEKLRDESTAIFAKLSQRETQIKELEADLQSANALVTKSQRENADLRAALQDKEKKIFTYKQLEEEITVLNQRQLA